MQVAFARDRRGQQVCWRSKDVFLSQRQLFTCDPITDEFAVITAGVTCSFICEKADALSQNPSVDHSQLPAANVLCELQRYSSGCEHCLA
jgi:hypothetical protein